MANLMLLGPATRLHPELGTENSIRIMVSRTRRAGRPLPAWLIQIQPGRRLWVDVDLLPWPNKEGGEK